MGANEQKNVLFTTGMPLVNPHSVNQRFTHRELTLIVGIIVAMIVVVTLWMNRVAIPGGQPKSDASATTPTSMLRQSFMNLNLF